MNTSILDKSTLYSCLPVSRSKLYDPEFIKSINQLHSIKTTRATTEKNITILEKDLLSRPRLINSSKMGQRTVKV